MMKVRTKISVLVLPMLLVSSLSLAADGFGRNYEPVCVGRNDQKSKEAPAGESAEEKKEPSAASAEVHATPPVAPPSVAK